MNRLGSDIDVRGGVRDYAIATEHAVRLWALSAELTGVAAFRGLTWPESGRLSRFPTSGGVSEDTRGYTLVGTTSGQRKDTLL